MEVRTFEFFSFFIVFYLLSDTSTNEYFNGKSGLTVPVDTVDFADRTSKALHTSQSNTQQRKSSLAKLDSVDIVDCKDFFEYLEIVFFFLN